MKKGCIKKKGFEDGIPVWQSFMFHFWPTSASPLGNEWTLAPENYRADNPDGIGNYYLGAERMIWSIF
jgi:DNA mismatch repair protein MSH3